MKCCTASVRWLKMAFCLPRVTTMSRIVPITECLRYCRGNLRSARMLSKRIVAWLKHAVWLSRPFVFSFIFLRCNSAMFNTSWILLLWLVSKRCLITSVCRNLRDSWQQSSFMQKHNWDGSVGFPDRCSLGGKISLSVGCFSSTIRKTSKWNMIG